jgi:hypothetical protein
MNSKTLLRISAVLFLLCFFGSGCSSKSAGRPTRWSKGQLESKIKDGAKLKEIHLTEIEKGKYEGTGTGEDGLAYKIKATYTFSEVGDKSEYEFHWDAESPKGEHKSGNDKGTVTGTFSIKLD